MAGCTRGREHGTCDQIPIPQSRKGPRPQICKTGAPMPPQTSKICVKTLLLAPDCGGGPRCTFFGTQAKDRPAGTRRCQFLSQSLELHQHEIVLINTAVLNAFQPNGKCQPEQAVGKSPSRFHDPGSDGAWETVEVYRGWLESNIIVPYYGDM